MSTRVVTSSDSLPSGVGAGAWPYYVGAAADTLVGVVLLLFAEGIARLMLPGQEAIFGIAAASVMRILGAFLILFAVETVVVARSNGRLARYRAWIVAANWATVALAVVVLALWHALFSVTGVTLVAAIAVALAAMAVLQGKCR